jgi:hypothetical protein
MSLGTPDAQRMPRLVRAPRAKKLIEEDPMPLIGQYEKVTRISGPVCPNGGHLRAVVSFAEEPGQIVVSLHAECVNSCLTDNLEPYAAVKIIDTAGNVRSELAAELPLVPAKGWPWNGDTSRSVDEEVILTAPLVVGRIEFELKNQSAGSPFIDFIEFAGGLALSIIGVLREAPRGLPSGANGPCAPSREEAPGKSTLESALSRSRGDLVQAARLLGISRTALHIGLAENGLLPGQVRILRQRPEART